MIVMKLEIGKIIEFNDFFGKITSKSGTYVFFKDDIINNSKIELNDYVIFRPDRVNEINRAFFVQYFSKNINNLMDIKSNLTRLLKRG